MTSIDTGIASIRSALQRLVDAWNWYCEIPAVARIHGWLAQIRDGWRRLMRALNSVMPKGLYARALLIIILPMVILQSVLALVFVERQLNEVTQRLSAGVVADIAGLIDVYKGYPQDADRAQIRRIAQERLDLVVDFLALGDLPPPGPKPFFSLLDSALSDQLRKQIGRPFWIDTVGKSALVEIRVQLDNTVMRVFARRSAAYASNAGIFLFWMVGTSTVLLIVAIIFLRNQIKPILRLADAAESFGKGREVPNFRPRGAREVRRAAAAFIEMKTRHRARHRAAHRHARRRLARSAHRAHPLQARTGADQEEDAGSRGDEERRRRDGAHARSLSGLCARRSRRGLGADRHGGISGGNAARRRAARPQSQRGLPRAAGRHRAPGGIQALPRQSGVERGAPRAVDLDHRPPRSPLADGDGGRRRAGHSGADARRSVQAVLAARRRAQSGRRRHRPRPRHRARHRALARRRHHARRIHRSAACARRCGCRCKPRIANRSPNYAASARRRRAVDADGGASRGRGRRGCSRDRRGSPTSARRAYARSSAAMVRARPSSSS